MLDRAVVVGAFLLAATPAAAEMTLEIQTAGGPIRPGAESRALEALLTIDCLTILARTVDAPATMTMDFRAPSGVIVTGPPSEAFVAADCPPGAETLTRRISYALTVGRGERGFTEREVVAEARFEAHPSDAAVGGTPAADAAFTITTGAELASEVTVPEKIKRCGCPVTFDVAVTNLGNVRTRYTVELAVAPAAGTVTLPEPFELEPSTPGSTSTGTVKVVFQAPTGSWPGEVVFSVTVLSTAAQDPAEVGGPLTAHMLVHNGGVGDQRVPGLDPVVALLVLASLAGAAARRRA